MKKIKLTQGKFAVVDDCDFEYLNQWKWCTGSNGRGNLYAVRTKRGKTIRMAREVAYLAGVNLKKFIDHINGDTLDNRRCNLRVATNQQNQFNTGPQVNNTSGYKGISWEKDRNKWAAQIRVNEKTKHLGRYKDK